MNKQGSPMEEELRFRKWVQTILIEEAIYEAASSNPEILLEYMLNEEDDLIGVFVDPFKDLFNVAKVATKDLLSIAKFNFDLLITLSPEKMDKARAKYDARTKKIEAEWEKAARYLKGAKWPWGDDFPPPGSDEFFANSMEYWQRYKSRVPGTTKVGFFPCGWRADIFSSQTTRQVSNMPLAT